MQGDPAFRRRSRWEKLDDAARCGFCGRDGGHHNVGHHMDGLARLSGQEAIKNVAPSRMMSSGADGREKVASSMKVLARPCQSPRSLRWAYRRISCSHSYFISTRSDCFIGPRKTVTMPFTSGSAGTTRYPEIRPAGRGKPPSRPQKEEHLEDGGHRHARRHALDDEYIDADRRGDEPHFNDYHANDAKPYGVDPRPDMIGNTTGRVTTSIARPSKNMPRMMYPRRIKNNVP